jgi:glutamate/tyrosine decarboxylase-like PLP-dependent enzyme
MNVDESLSLPPEEMRRLGYRVVDLIVDHFTSVRSKSLDGVKTRTGLEAALREPLPEHGADPDGPLKQLVDVVFPAILHLDHPRFFAFVPSPSNYVSVLADALASGFNVFAGSWLEASGPTVVELVVVDWLRELCGLPADAGGLFVPSGSLANLTAVILARERNGAEGIVYCSDQAHSSVLRAFRVLGIPASRMRIVETDDSFRFRPAELEKTMREDAARSMRPMCVVATAGTTNTGAFDPLVPLRSICNRYDAWLHVDGAYGAAAALSSRGREAVHGLGAADSIALDPHKWLFQPFEAGCLLVRHPAALREAFRILPEYLSDLEIGEINFCDYGLQLTRSFRALKVWLSLKVFGASAFRAAVDKGIELAEYAERRIRESTVLELVTSAQFGIVTFRVRSTTADLRAICKRLMTDGVALLSTTEIRGRSVLRMCTINPRTTPADIDQTVEAIERIATGREAR